MDPSSVFPPQKAFVVKPRYISYREDFHRPLESGLKELYLQYTMFSKPLILPFSSLLRTEARDLVSRGSSRKCSACISSCPCGKLSASSSGTNLIEPKQWGKRVWRDVQRCVPINSGRRRRAKDLWRWPKKSGLCKSASKEVCDWCALPSHSPRLMEPRRE